MQARRGRRLAMVVGVLVGAGLGLALGAGIHAVLVPVLEASEGPVRELQGLVWNLVPFGTVGGGVLGWLAAQRWVRGRDDRWN